jgi:hypothetical protein
MRKIFLIISLLALALSANVRAYTYDALIGDTMTTGTENALQDSAIILSHTSYTYVASAGDVVDSIYIWSWTGSSGHLKVAIYDITTGDTNLVGSVEQVTPTTNTHKYWGTDVDIALTAGHRYAVAMGNRSGSAGTVYTDSASKLCGSFQVSDPVLGSIFVPTNELKRVYGVYATVKYAAASCTAPSNTLTFIDSTLTTVKFQNAIAGGSTTKDSTQYFNNGVYLYRLLKADSATQRIIISGLTSGTSHYIKAISWDSTCSSTADSILTKTVSPPVALTGCDIDSLHNDKSGENDSVSVDFDTPSQTGNDYVIFVWDTSYHDSTYVTNRDSIAYQPSTNLSKAVYYNGIEAYDFKLSAWIKDALRGYGPRCQSMLTFYAPVPSADQKVRVHR